MPLTISNPLGFLLSPRQQWQRVAQVRDTQWVGKLAYPLILAIGPCLAWYYGSSEIGWSVGGGETVRLTQHSATQIVVAFYLAMLASLAVIGYFIHWMSATYGATSTPLKGIVLASYTATPLFAAGLIGFYPLFWLDLVLGIAALGWSVYLLYVGIPIAMSIPEDRGFFYASAVIAICMVIFMALMGAVVILWDIGMMPVFTHR
ncbi:YIP1 family protein [Spongiibacter taiwanensis]|uniref:Yip1 family protein n=1 Tax=Spongiibacter taiwanensis TaxID=1748242 RepID=UPI0020350973|nr:Yip1 family protein [Spongiibacter taiwanensis]USA43035.1 YIP1 family protein [Spongiibacter taiwanensis]